jgi:hypothetical protein
LDTVNINLKVFGKNYPLKFRESDLHLFTQAQNELNAQLEFYKNKGVQDKQDLLVMVVFESLMSKLTAKKQSENEMNELGQTLDGMMSHLNT